MRSGFGAASLASRHCEKPACALLFSHSAACNTEILFFVNVHRGEGKEGKGARLCSLLGSNLEGGCAVASSNGGSVSQALMGEEEEGRN